MSATSPGTSATKYSMKAFSTSDDTEVLIFLLFLKNRREF